MTDLDDSLMTDSADEVTGARGAVARPAGSQFDAVVASAVQGFDAGASVVHYHNDRLTRE